MERKKKKEKNPFPKMILKYVGRHKWSYVGGVITLFIVDFANLYIPQFTGDIIDGLTIGDMNIKGALHYVFLILLVGFILMVGRFFWRYFIFGSCRKIELEIREDMFSHLTGLSMNYYNRNKTGDLMAHFTNDLNSVRMAVGPAVISTFDAVIMTIMVLVKMIQHVNLELTLIAILPLLVILFGGVYYGRAIETRFSEKQQAFSDLTDEVQESISGIRVIKAFVQERQELKSFARANKNNKDKNMRVVKLNAVVWPLLEALIGLSSVITLLYGGYLVSEGAITAGQFVAFNQYIGMLVWPMIATGDSINMFSQGIASMNRIQSIFDEQPEIKDTEKTMDSIKELHGEIKLKHLTFRYKQALPDALKNIDVTVPKGSTLAILGRTGSGKTTIANLIARFYDVTGGSVLIDGHDVRDCSISSLRKLIGVVNQDPIIFNDSLRTNIAYGSPDATDEEIIRAAKLANAHEFIVNGGHEDGYDSIAGENGFKLSGGEKQRITIARAILRNPPVLILDEATSALDNVTERLVQDALNHAMQDRTVFVIAHRLSTIEHADRIIVLKQGKIAETGTHQELLELNGLYRKLHDTKFD